MYIARTIIDARLSERISEIGFEFVLEVYIGYMINRIKTLSHGAFFLATCNAFYS